MLKIARKIKARALDCEKKTAAAAAEVAAEAAAAAAALAEPREPPALWKSGDPKKPWKNPKNLPCEVPPEKFLTEKERRKLEKKLLEQRRKAEKKKEKERKKLEKMQKKKKKGSAAQEAARHPEAAAAATAAAGAAEGARGGGEGAGIGGMNRIWAQCFWDEDDAYYAEPRVGGVAWQPGSPKSSELSAHLPLVVFLMFSVRSPSWVLNFLLQKRTEHGRGCGFVFGATCCFRMFLGCAFFSYWGGRTKRRGRGRSGATGSFGSGHGARRRGRGERLI